MAADRPAGVAPEIDQMPRERQAISVRMKGLAPLAQELCHSLQVEEQRELSRWIVPLARVIVLDPRGQRRERLDLDLVRPPA